MASPVALNDSNQFSALSSPIDDGKTQDGLRARFSKDDIKEQAYQAREMVKAKAIELKEQVVAEGLVATVQHQLQPALEFAKAKVGLQTDLSKQEDIDHAKDTAAGEWQEVKHKGHAKAKHAADKIDAKLNEKLTPAQRAKLDKGARALKSGAVDLERRAEGWSARLVQTTLAGPRLRPVRNFIQRNNLQLPAVLLGSLLSLWLGLSLIRLITSVATPARPELDIHSASASQAWLKYHAGEYRDKAIDARDSLSARAAAFLANHKYEQLKSTAVDYRDIGLSKLGLTEPTWGEWAWAKLTGRPITWQERVDSVLGLAQDGIARANAKTGGLYDRVKTGVNGLLHKAEPTMGDRAHDAYDNLKAHLPGGRTEPAGVIDSLRATLNDGIDSIRAKLPGGVSAEELKQRAYDATHRSTLDQIKTGAEYIKNRVVHGAQEAAHIAQDRANELADKAKYKTGL